MTVCYDTHTGGDSTGTADGEGFCALVLAEARHRFSHAAGEGVEITILIPSVVGRGRAVRE